MTAIKQVSITSATHSENLGNYLNDERALMRDSQNITNPDNWEEEMSHTREAFGHDVPSRAGTINTLMYHQILAFNPDECSVNGGPMTPERCMEYAKEYISSRYPNQEAIWVLHQEHCAADGTERFAIHIGINRTDLETGLRLNEGRSKYAKIERANYVRDMDKKYGLKQLVAGERNCAIHARQPSRGEQILAAQGTLTDKQYIRNAINASMKEMHSCPEGKELQQFASLLSEKGVRMTVSKNGKNFIFERQKTGFKVGGNKLGRGYSKAGIAKALGIRMARFLVYAAEQSMD